MSLVWKNDITILWWSTSDYLHFPSTKKKSNSNKKRNIRILVSLFIAILILIFVYFGKISIKSISKNGDNLNIKVGAPIYNIWSGWMDTITSTSGTLLYSPKNSRYERQDKIKQSSDYLYIWIYNITHKDAINIIKNLAKNKVQVRFILEDKKYLQWEDNSADIDLSWRGIQVKNDSDLGTNYVHAKWFVSSGFAILQTANLTYGWFESSREYYFISEDSQIVSNLKLIYQYDRAGTKIDPEMIHPNILVCPIDCRSKIQKLLESATTSILIQNQYIQDDTLTNILKKKRDQYIDLKINLPKNDDNLIYQSSFGTGLRLMNSPYIHAKAMLIDDKYLVISSINMSSNSMDNNRELGIITTDSEAIEKFKEVFYVDWEKWK